MTFPWSHILVRKHILKYKESFPLMFATYRCELPHLKPKYVYNLLFETEFFLDQYFYWDFVLLRNNVLALNSLDTGGEKSNISRFWVTQGSEKVVQSKWNFFIINSIAPRLRFRGYRCQWQQSCRRHCREFVIACHHVGWKQLLNPMVADLCHFVFSLFRAITKWW